VLLCAKDAFALPENGVIDIPEITYCRRKFDGMDLYFFVNSTRETYRAHIPVGTHIMDPVTGELFPFDGNYEFRKYASLAVIDDGGGRSTSSSVKPKKALPLDGEWTVISATENCMTLDYCEYAFDGEIQGERAYVLDVMYRALALGRQTRVAMTYTVRATHLPRSLFLVCETPEKFDIRVNGKAVDMTDRGYFRDKSFRKLDIAELFVKGENRITLETDFYQSPGVYENMEKSKIFESEKNKLTFDTELEQIYLVGDFSVETEGEFAELERNASRFSGEFSIGAPRKVITLDRMERQGFPFFAGTVTVSCKFRADGTDYVLDFVKSGWNVVKASVNGSVLPPLLWEPLTRDVSALLHDGENEIALTLTNNLRNMQGPFHLALGESHNLGPAQFYREKCLWGGGIEKWNDGYCFLNHSLKTR